MMMPRRPSKVRKEEGVCDVRGCLKPTDEASAAYETEESVYDLCEKHRNLVEDGFQREAERTFLEAQSVWDADTGCFTKGRPKSSKYVLIKRNENGKWRAALRSIETIYDMKRE
jgi:hypothetical protein